MITFKSNWWPGCSYSLFLMNISPCDSNFWN